VKKAGRYSKEFKLEAVRLLKSKEKPGSEIARELGIKRTLLYRWKDQMEQKGDESFSGPGNLQAHTLTQIN